MTIALAPCPGCSVELPEAASYCWVCRAYLADLLPGDSAPDKQGRPSVVPDDRSEAERQLGIRRTLEPLGYYVADMSQDRPTRQAVGVADLWVSGNGVHGWLEVKSAKGRQSPGQRKFEVACATGGCRYAVVRSEEEAVRVVQTWRAEAEG